MSTEPYIPESSAPANGELELELLEERTTEWEADNRALEITERDKSWLEALGCVWDEESGPELTELVKTGSPHIDVHDSLERQQQILGAREYFFARLPEISDTANVYQTRPNGKYLVPLATFVTTQRYMQKEGLDAAKAINTFPATISYAPESVKAKVENLQSFGLDATKVINTFPTTIGYAPESVKAKVENLQSFGLDASKVINKSPAIIGLAPGLVSKKLARYERLFGRESTVQLVESFPVSISYANAKVMTTYRLLSTLEIDTVPDFKNRIPRNTEALLLAMAMQIEPPESKNIYSAYKKAEGKKKAIGKAAIVEELRQEWIVMPENHFALSALNRYFWRADAKHRRELRQNGVHCQTDRDYSAYVRANSKSVSS